MNSPTTLDQKDPLARFRERFIFPRSESGKQAIYFCGNSLGLQPKSTLTYVTEELEDWGALAVEGHFKARHPWLPYHEFLTEQTARLVGAKPIEVVVMNSLTVNLHLMMLSFYQPTSERFKILIEGGAFPSDQYAVDSQIRLQGLDPRTALIELTPRAGEHCLRNEDIVSTIEREGSQLALVMLGGVNYLTGQAFDLKEITRAAHSVGAYAGYDLAHAAGNLELKLHDWKADFAVWCSYKYLNAGPGAIAGCFVHEKHAKAPELKRLQGWWGHDKKRRFKMEREFQPIPGAEGWQLSNPPILQLAALRASMEIFDEATMSAIRKKSEKLTQYLDDLIRPLGIEILTPKDAQARGAQISLRVANEPKKLLSALAESDMICDFREPNVIRVAPTGLYTSFADVSAFAQVLAQHLGRPLRPDHA